MSKTLDSSNLITNVYHKRDAFSRLPLELLMEIAETLYAKEQINPPKSVQFTATWILSIVNRRWRSVTLPILSRKLVLKRPQCLLELVERFIDGGSQKHLVHAVRSLCICASYDYNRLRARPLPYYRLPLPFVNLREFICKSPILWRATIDMLKCCPSLKSLTLCYLDEWPISLLRKLTKLQTLHLYAYNYRETPVFWRKTVILDPTPTPYASITTLTLHSRGGSSEMINECLSECHFPRLLVFAIRRCTVEPLAIFQFVHQHPTLVEVNADFVSREEVVPEVQICIEAILQLISGTGNWFDDRQASLMGQPASRVRYHGDDIGHWPSPILVPGSQTTCYAFAYARAALDPRISTQNQKQHQETKYKCTALALRGLCVNDADLDVPSALAQFRTVFPDVEQLRLQIDGHDELADYVTFKSGISDNLKHLRHLRNLSIHWLPRDDHYDSDIYDSSDSDSCTMNKWQTVHDQFETRIARCIARACPLLETFDWYISDSTHPEYNFPGGIVARSWRIQRRGSGRKLTRMVGDIFYDSFTRTSPPPLYPLVGQELARAVKHGYLHLDLEEPSEL